MAKIPNKIIDIIKKFIIEADKDNIHISKAILFGSYAKGLNNEMSDIDLAVVSNDFEGTKFYDCQKLNPALIRTCIDIELHPYRPEEFDEGNPFIHEILSYGIAVA